MNKKLIIAALLVSLSGTSLAQTPSFNYFDIGYSNWDPDSNNSIDGYELKGSKQLNDNWYIAGDFNRISENGVSFNLFTLGAGYKSNFSDTSSFFAEVDYANFNPSIGASESGYELTLGIRSMVMKSLELKGAVEYLDIGSGSSSFVLGSVYSFTDNFALYLDYKIESDVNRLGIGARYNF